MSIRKLIREIIEEEEANRAASATMPMPQFPKGSWHAVEPGSEEFEALQDHIYNLVNTAYAGIGGHIKISSPQSLGRYKYWVVNDHDDDPEIDIAIFGKPEFGTKSGGVGHDGSAESVSLYKNKSADLRKGGTIDGIGNWWGEVSGKAAYGLISRGAPAVEDEAMVAQLLDGDSYTWHGEHPSPNAPEMFKSKKGWYTKDFGPGGKHTKIILGIPS